MIKNEEDKVAMVLYQPIPRLVGAYYFDVRHGISFSWVDEAAVPSLLAERGGCCGSSRQIVFLANQEHINVWTENHY